MFTILKILLFFISLLVSSINTIDNHRNKDIIIFCSLPKSGTTLIIPILTFITKLNKTYNHTDGKNKKTNINYDVWCSKITIDKINLCHSESYEYVLKYLKENKNVKVIISYRDIRDVLVSECFMKKVLTFNKILYPNLSDYNIAKTLFFNLLNCDFTNAEHNLKNNCIGIIQLFKSTDNRIFKIKFENLIGSYGYRNNEQKVYFSNAQEKIIIDLHDFLDLEYNKSTLKHIKNNIIGKKKKSWTFRKGVVGEWENFFTDADITMFNNSIFKQYLNDLNYN